MAKRNKKTANYTAKIADLRRLGFTDLPHAQRLTTSQKRSVSAKHSRYHSLAKNLHKLQKIKLKKGEEKLLKQSGYTTLNGSVFVPKAGYDHVRMRRNKTATYIEKTQTSGGKVKKKYTERIGQANDKLDWKARLNEEADALNLRKGEYLGVRVYENNTFSVAGIATFDRGRAIRYLENDVHIKGGISREKFLDNVHFVKLSFPAGTRNLPLPTKHKKKKRRPRR